MFTLKNKLFYFHWHPSMIHFHESKDVKDKFTSLLVKVNLRLSELPFFCFFVIFTILDGDMRAGML